jgi:hypothetical protein
VLVSIACQPWTGVGKRPQRSWDADTAYTLDADGIGKHSIWLRTRIGFALKGVSETAVVTATADET